MLFNRAAGTTTANVVSTKGTPTPALAASSKHLHHEAEVQAKDPS